AYVIEILRGANTERIRDRNHDTLTVYGIGKGLGIQEWRDLSRALLHQGLMRESQDGYSVLSLNEASWQVLRGEREVHVRVTEKPRGRGKSTSRSGSTPDDGLFEALRALRKLIADRAGVPPYIVFNDASLREITERQPTTLDEFASITGVGEAKLTRYGREFVELIAERVSSPARRPL